MTNPNLTAIAVLMDRSGSMTSVRSDAEGGLQAFIDDQRTLPGLCTIRLSDFDTEYRIVYPSTRIQDAPHYVLEPRGGTALLDGIGRLVTEFGAELAAMAEVDRPGKVLVVVQTDGFENSSKQWTRERVNALIEDQQSSYGWNFVFLGANQDAIAVGTSLGFRPGSSMTYANTGVGLSNTSLNLSAYAGRLRSVDVDSASKVEFTEQERVSSMETD